MHSHFRIKSNSCSSTYLSSYQNDLVLCSTATSIVIYMKHSNISVLCCGFTTLATLHFIYSLLPHPTNTYIYVHIPKSFQTLLMLNNSVGVLDDLYTRQWSTPFSHGIGLHSLAIHKTSNAIFMMKHSGLTCGQFQICT